MIGLIHKIMLPGNDYQLNFLLEQVDLSSKNMLILGNGLELASIHLSKTLNLKISIIVEDHESLLNARLVLSDSSEVKTKFMNFEKTDYNNDSFDVIYAQASISNKKRNKIIKEVKRILKPGGFFCVGEILSIKEPVPSFVNEVWEAGEIIPLNINSLLKHYTERGLELISEIDLSDKLNNYYLQVQSLLKKEMSSLSTEDKSINKKMLNRLKHESNVYLKLGGDDYIGMKSLLLRLPN